MLDLPSKCLGRGTWALAGLPAWPHGPTVVPGHRCQGSSLKTLKRRAEPHGPPSRVTRRLGPLKGAEIQMEGRKFTDRHSKVPISPKHPLTPGSWGACQSPEKLAVKVAALGLEVILGGVIPTWLLLQGL